MPSSGRPETGAAVPNVQLLSQNPLTLMLQKPWLQNAIANFTEGTVLKAAGFGGLSVFTIYTSR